MMCLYIFKQYKVGHGLVSTPSKIKLHVYFCMCILAFFTGTYTTVRLPHLFPRFNIEKYPGFVKGRHEGN